MPQLCEILVHVKTWADLVGIACDVGVMDGIEPPCRLMGTAISEQGHWNEIIIMRNDDNDAGTPR